MNDINSIKTLELITKANNLSLKKGYNEISLENKLRKSCFFIMVV